MEHSIASTIRAGEISQACPLKCYVIALVCLTERDFQNRRMCEMYDILLSHVYDCSLDNTLSTSGFAHVALLLVPSVVFKTRDHLRRISMPVPAAASQNSSEKHFICQPSKQAFSCCPPRNISHSAYAALNLSNVGGK